MPYESIHHDPEVLLSYKGIEILYVYKDNEYDNALSFWYGIDQEDNGVEFDIRDLPNFTGEDNRDVHVNVVREAIDRGYLDEYIERAGCSDPKLYELPKQIADMDRLQLIQLLDSYDTYIQDANTDNKYAGGWMPVCINEYFDNEFQSELEEGVHNANRR